MVHLKPMAVTPQEATHDLLPTPSQHTLGPAHRTGGLGRTDVQVGVGLPCRGLGPLGQAPTKAESCHRVDGVPGFLRHPQEDPPNPAYL